jgi:hypothetical protein
MMNQTEWQAVRDALIADDRARLGAPPTAEELLAYERGELSADAAARVQQLLVAYPELARAFATPFPPEDVEPLAGDVIDRQWNAFRAGRGTGARVLRFWRGLSALAAALALVLGTMLWNTRMELRQPQHLPPETHVLTPDGGRGLDQQHYTITPKGDWVVLVVSIVGPTAYEMYRLELVNAVSHTRIWSSQPLRAPNSESFNVEMPTRALRPGTYQVIAYGLRGNAEAQVATYTIDVRSRP